MVTDTSMIGEHWEHRSQEISAEKWHCQEVSGQKQICQEI
jgi:hypothetical protein